MWVKNQTVIPIIPTSSTGERGSKEIFDLLSVPHLFPDLTPESLLHEVSLPWELESGDRVSHPAGMENLLP